MSRARSTLSRPKVTRKPSTGGRDRPPLETRKSIPTDPKGKTYTRPPSDNSVPATHEELLQKLQWELPDLDIHRGVKEQLDKTAVRIWRPGSVGTMDYRPDRINVRVDSGGKFLKAWMG